jgi:Ca2+/Na+ antiporter
MREIIWLLTDIVNEVHDVIETIADMMNLNMTDKDLHLWVFGLLGMVIFFFTHILFKWISIWSIEPISFFYAFTVMVVLAFAIEIQQKITGRGQMEFLDAVIGLWGFVIFFFIYVLLKTFIILVRRFLMKNNEKEM